MHVSPADVQSSENHPRPQLTRARWTDLCGRWSFAFDDRDLGLFDGWQAQAEVFNRFIEVPFPYESPASGIGDPSPHAVVWYRRQITPPARGDQERVMLHFGAVDYAATVWVNGEEVARHEGGHTPFSTDITRALGIGSDATLVVRAEDRALDLSQPRGKQDWETHPHKVWYHRTSGIWQPVWMEVLPQLHVTEVRWTPDLDRGTLGLRVELSRPPDRPLVLRVRLSVRGAPLADDRYVVRHAAISRDIALEQGEMTMGRDMILWSPEHPNLVDAVLTLLYGDEIIDEVASYAGLRSTGITDSRFQLNGRPYYPRLVLAQNYWPESHLAAPSGGALRREVELIRELGFNGVRIHQKVEDPRFLYWCDRLGLLVWGEMANAYVFSPTAVERLTREWLDVVRRDYSHPCIVTWVPLNESWGVPNLAADPAQQHYVRALYALTKAIDSTRPVIGNDGWEHLASDVWGIHDYALSGETLRARYGDPAALETSLRSVVPAYRSLVLHNQQRAGQPVMLTEFGGISDAGLGDRQWLGYGSVNGQGELLSKFEELVGAVLSCPTLSGFCYTQLTDTGQERNGLLTADRIPKMEPAAIAAIVSRPSAALPGEVIAQLQRAAEVTPFETVGT